MKDTTNGNAIRVYEIMKEKEYTPEEIEAFLHFLDARMLEITQPLQTMFFTGFGVMAVLILVAPELTRRIAERFISR